MEGPDEQMKKDRGMFGAVRARIRSGRPVVNIVLACAAVALEVYYSICGGSCSYLRGDLFGIGLQYIGIAYMGAIVLLTVLKLRGLLLVLLSAGVGIELYLVGFQVRYNTYCPYCLGFGAIVLLLFLLNFSNRRKKLSIISMAVALLLFSIFFEGSVTPTFAGQVPAAEPGQGHVGAAAELEATPPHAL